ncbi:hypothetical protein ES703_78676 [subsurface metagenome]
MAEKLKKSQIKGQEEVLLTFLQKTKDGKYTPVDLNSFIFSRTIQEHGMIVQTEEEYFYSLS